jgi:endonuclease I
LEWPSAQGSESHGSPSGETITAFFFFVPLQKTNNVRKSYAIRLWLQATLPLLFIFFISNVFAQIPSGYYDPANGKTGVALQTALHNIIKGHTVVSYSSIPGYFSTTDAKPGSVVWDMYSDVPGGTPPYTYHYNMGQECGNYGGEGDCYNREHSWPKSWFNDVPPMNSDMFHIYPTDGYVNGRRSNYAYGTVSSSSWTSLNGCKLGSCNWPGFSGTVFEPLDEYKGDFARTYFYMSTRYYTEDGSWNTTDMTIKSQLKPWALQMMLHWCSIDPVSTKETNRNNAMYGIQHNRNPFIDHPEYAYQIWGNPVGTQELNAVNQVDIYPNPAVDRCSIELPAGFSTSRFNLMVMSVTGARFNIAWSLNGNTLSMNVEKMPKGIYFLMLTGEQATYRSKLIKD